MRKNGLGEGVGRVEGRWEKVRGLEEGWEGELW